MVINIKTHNWSRCREQETLDCSASKMIYLSYTFLPSPRGFVEAGEQRDCRSQRRWMTMRKKFPGYIRAVLHMNSKQLRQHAQDPCKLMTNKICFEVFPIVPGDWEHFMFPWLPRFHISVSSQPSFRICDKRPKCHPSDAGFTVMQVTSYVVMEASTRSQSLGNQAELSS